MICNFKFRSAWMLLLSMASIAMWAQGSKNYASYYAGAKGSKGKALKTALYKIISGHTQRTYKDLWQDFKKTDVRPDGTIWDIYSNVTSYTPGGSAQGANYKKEGDSYNREHSFPKSWFDDGYPMYTDLFHLYPADGYVNNRRSNYPFGETDGETYQSAGGFSKLGACTIPGYTGTVFEPNDEYKGDLARSYFYMVTAYEDKVAGWNTPMLNKTAYPAFSDWALTMFLRWADEDPVSEKEVNRNEAIYGIQHNRNPYIDYPGLEQYVWGTMTTTAFNPADYTKPGTTPTPDPDPDPTPDPDPKPDPDPTPEPDPDENLYVMATSDADVISGAQTIIVCTGKSVALSVAPSNGDYRTGADVTVNADATISTTTNTTAMPCAIIVNGKGDGYTLYDSESKAYLSYRGSNNSLFTTEDGTLDETLWTVSIASDGTALISPSNVSDRYINYNASSPRFACYQSKSKQLAVQLYVKTTSDGIAMPVSSNQLVDVYDLNGRCVHRQATKADVRALPSGIYVINGHKVLVR